uniref:Uncharacterized protein n=1 Tax=Davidia involucrata TaxID=16924 RepID=A0A5B6ZGI4_DAVIN
MARRSFRALKGLVRLQGVVRGQNVKRQTMNAMKHMQLLVRVQTQIQSRRIQMLENQVLQRQAYKNDKELESSLGKWTMSQLVSFCVLTALLSNLGAIFTHKFDWFTPIVGPPWYILINICSTIQFGLG